MWFPDADPQGECWDDIDFPAAAMRKTKPAKRKPKPRKGY